MKTVLITGCSSGYGLETARHFHTRGWNVIATMRTPREDILPRSERLRVLALDVTKPASIVAALEASGPIDVLVNNAGIGLFGAFEVTPMTTVREVFEANTFGVMAMTQAALPQLRARRSGVIVNVTSSATLAPMPLVAAYTASKMASKASPQSLAFELAEFDVRVKLGRARLRTQHCFYEEQWLALGRADPRGIRAPRPTYLRDPRTRARRLSRPRATSLKACGAPPTIPRVSCDFRRARMRWRWLKPDDWRRPPDHGRIPQRRCRKRVWPAPGVPSADRVASSL